MYDPLHAAPLVSAKEESVMWYQFIATLLSWLGESDRSDAVRPMHDGTFWPPPAARP